MTVKVCVLQCNIVTGGKEEAIEGLFHLVMEIEFDLKREWEIGGGWEPQTWYSERKN